MSPRASSASTGPRWLDVTLLAIGGLLLVLAVYWLTGLVDRPSSAPSLTVPDTVEERSGVPAATPDDTVLLDEAFGVAMRGQGLRRIVQILQWREVASVGLAIGDEIVADQGDYQLLWSERVIDSSRFAEPQGHVNPPAPPYRSWSVGPQSDTGIDSEAGDAWRHVPTSQVRLPENLMAVFRAEGAWLVTTPEGDLPQAGDMRVRFELLPAPAPAAPGTDADVEAAAAASSDADPVAEALAWIARAAAFIMAMVGAGLVLRGAAGFAVAGSWLQRLPPIAVLSLSIWIAVAATLVAVGITRVF